MNIQYTSVNHVFFKDTGAVENHKSSSQLQNPFSKCGKFYLKLLALGEGDWWFPSQTQKRPLSMQNAYPCPDVIHGRPEML